MNPSVRQRLLLLLLVTITIAWSATAYRNYTSNREEIAELFDAHLAQSARALLGLSVHELHEQLAYQAQEGKDLAVPESGKSQVHKYEHHLAYQIWVNDTMLAARSANAPLDPLATTFETFHDREINGGRWRVYALVDNKSHVRVHVGELYEQRDSLSASIAQRSLITLAISLPLLALLIWFGVGRAMAPLYRIARAVGKRQITNLEPIPLHGVPEEARPLVTAINALFLRLRESLDNIINFTADAAHELRTPLAALKTHAQVAARATDDATRNAALNEITYGVNRAAYLMDHMLILTRLDPEQAKLCDETTELQSICESILAELATEALEKHIELSLNAPVRGCVIGKTGMLEILARNLVENAIRYTPEHGSVDVSVLQEGGEIILRVDDSGPGIPANERERVFKRFYRGLGTDTIGSGLGLSIVKRVAEIHDAKIELGESAHGGLRFDVRLRAAQNVEQALPRMKVAS